MSETNRPQTALLPKQQNEKNSSNEETRVGDAFFSKQEETEQHKTQERLTDDDSNDNLVDKNQNYTPDSHIEAYQTITDNGSPKSRPKTVIKHRTDGYQQQLVNIGATESNKLNQDETLSPKPKSEKCYICQKEFLLTSLKIHEKQCAKKHEKPPNVNNKTEVKISKKLQLETCYLCGKEFFVHSLGIHETQCIKNWKANKTPDASDQTVSEMLGAKDNSLAEQMKVNVLKDQELSQNKKSKVDVFEESPKREKASNVFPKLQNKSDSRKQKSPKLTPCYLCGVAFLPNSLKIHERKCKGHSNDIDQIESIQENKSRSQVENSKLEQDAGFENDTFQPSTSPQHIGKTPKTIICYICGLEFLKSSYTFHEKKCASVSERERKQKKENNVCSTKPETVGNRLAVNKTSNIVVSDTVAVDDIAQKYDNAHPNIVSDNMLAEDCQESSNKEITTDDSQAEESPMNKVHSGRTAKPRTIICYICGEEFLKSSYPFHEKKCCKIEASVEPPKSSQNNSKTSPKPKTIVCYICGREFLKSSYAFHEKKCSTISQEKTSQGTSKSNQSNPKSSPKPKTIVCYICGEEFLKSSFAFHEKKCSSKSNEDPSQTKFHDEKNDLARPVTPSKKPKTKACFICGKEMLLSSLKVHEQQCQKKADILKNINKSPAQKQTAGQRVKARTESGGGTPKTDVCYICGETFLATSIRVHETQCEKRWKTFKSC